VHRGTHRKNIPLYFSQRTQRLGVNNCIPSATVRKFSLPSPNMLKSFPKLPAHSPNAIFTAIMNIGMKKVLMFFVYVLVLSGVQQVTAQTKKVVADKIIGKVGDRIILQSDIINAINDIQRQGGEVPENADCLLMESELIKKALVLQAEKDSLTIDDAEVESIIENKIRNFMQAYGGREALEEIAGRTIYQIKEDFRKPIKEQELAIKCGIKFWKPFASPPMKLPTILSPSPKTACRFMKVNWK
jgi:hypothetical protein